VSGPGGSYRDGQASRSAAVAGGAHSAAMSAAVTDDEADFDRPASSPQPGTRGPKARRLKSRRPKSRRERTRRSRVRSRRWLAVWLLLAAMGLTGGVTWALLGSGLFAVRAVIVNGTRLVPESEVLAVAGIKPGTPLIRVNTARIAGRVLTIRQVLAVQVSKAWPDHIVIAVRERTPALAVVVPSGFDLIDANGVVVQLVQTRPATLPLYTTSAPVSSLRGDPDVSAAAAVVDELPAALRSTVTSVTVPSPDQVTLQLRSGVTVVWGGPDDAAAKAKELAVLMQTHARYYDVSSPATAVTN
jgi:cell division protein FtsQ